MTATDIHNKDETLKNDSVLQREIQFFINRWAPKDERFRADFSADLAVIVRRSAIEANAEITAHFARVAALMPPAPIFLRDPKK